MVDWQHFFAVWGLAWWGLTLVFLLGGLTLVYAQRGAYFLISVVLYLAVVQVMGDVPVIESIRQNPFFTLGLASIWGGVAVLWFNCRWYWLTARMKGRYDEVFHAWLEAKGLEDLPALTDSSEAALAVKSEWWDYFMAHQHDEEGLIEFRPAFRKHKNEILTWMAAWPLDVLVWLFGELLRDFCHVIYSQFQAVLQSIMERNWRGTEHHLLTPEQKEQGLR
jgi:hypothetical protein